MGSIADFNTGMVNLYDPKHRSPDTRVPVDLETPGIMFMSALNYATKIALAIGQFQVRAVYVFNIKRLHVEFVSVGVVVFKVLLFGGLFLKGAAKLKKMDTSSTFGHTKDVPIPLVVSGFGVLFTALVAYQTGLHHSDDVDPDLSYAWDPEFQAEEIATLIGVIALSCSFLNWSKVCNATKVDGIPMSTCGLVLLNMASLVSYLSLSTNVGIMSKTDVRQA